MTSLEMTDTSARRNLVTFRLHEQTYALPIEPIVQIIEMVTTTPIPQVSHSVEGVINVRGATVPIVDLRRHLGLPGSTPQLHTPILLVQTDEWAVGLIVDEVTDVLNVPIEQIARPADILPEGLGEAPVLRGLAHTDNGTILLLNLEHLFLPDQAQALAQAAAISPQTIAVSKKPSKDTEVKVVTDQEEKPSAKAKPARKPRKTAATKAAKPKAKAEPKKKESPPKAKSAKRPRKKAEPKAAPKKTKSARKKKKSQAKAEQEVKS
jgi:purine-binding chemotaxis protein CheW